MTVIFFIMMMQQYCIYYYHSKAKKNIFRGDTCVTNVQYDEQINAAYHRELYTQYETACILAYILLVQHDVSSERT